MVVLHKKRAICKQSNIICVVWALYRTLSVVMTLYCTVMMMGYKSAGVPYSYFDTFYDDG